MSLTKKDPSLRVAANDPHLVSLGGGRLSTAVTIHYIPIGDTTIGSSTACSISLNGSGVRATHCTIYRSEENEVTIVPEPEARILIDGTKITHETNLTQGAMITIGNSNYLRFNNPAEAQLMRSAMGSNERISMPQIDFTQTPASTSAESGFGGDGGGGDNGKGGESLRHSMDIETFFETKINPLTNGEFVEEDTLKIKSTSKYYEPVSPIDINGFQCPKVFTADLVTVNMPAKDVLGQKYANFAKNLAENHRAEKIVCNALRNNQVNGSKANTSTANAGSQQHQHQQQQQQPQQNGNSGSNIPNTSNFIQNPSSSSSVSHFAHSTLSTTTEYLTKVHNTSVARTSTQTHNVSAYDRYPKPGTYGGLQIYPMNGVNTEINNGGSAQSSPQHHHHHHHYHHQHQHQHQHQSSSVGITTRSQLLEQKRTLSNLSNSESERLEDMLKICSEYADRQNPACGSITSSPIVQNRIKTNGSLPREKKSPFYQDHSGGASGAGTSSANATQLQHSFSGSNSNLSAPKAHNSSSGSSNSNSNNNTHNCSTVSGYENVRLTAPNRVEISGQAVCTASKTSTGYENVVVGKYVPQSPRTKIRTTCLSPKKEQQPHGFGSALNSPPPALNARTVAVKQQANEYDQLIRTFEEKLKLEMQAIEESTRYRPPIAAKPQSLTQSPARRLNKNINNLTLNLQCTSLQNSPKLSKKPAPAPRSMGKAAATTNGSSNQTSLQPVAVSTRVVTREASIRILESGDAGVEVLKKSRQELRQRIQKLRAHIADLQRQESEALDEMNLEKALVSAELNAVHNAVKQYEVDLQTLRHKIHRLEAQRNATRVMEENQQAKLKQSIEMKQDQIRKLKEMLKQQGDNDCLKEEQHNVSESLDNDRKTFEDLEFQYLEEESEWHAYREELAADEKALMLKIEEKRLELQHLEKQDLTSQSTADARSVKDNLIDAVNELRDCQDQLKSIENRICDITGQLQLSSSDEEDQRCGHRSPSEHSQHSERSEHSVSGGSNLGSGVMSQSLFGSAELLCPKRSSEDHMSKSVNENMFYNNKIELPLHGPATSTPKRPQLQAVPIEDACADGAQMPSAGVSDEERLKLNLSLGSDDFEVNPLERRVPSQDDIDRICKVTSASPISTSASTKIFDSIKEIERNRQLLLAQQGHHVIEHERQRMHDLKKKSHDEARAQYLSMLSNGPDCKPNQQQLQEQQQQQQCQEQQELRQLGQHEEIDKENQQQLITAGTAGDQSREQAQRHSQPEFASESSVSGHHHYQPIIEERNAERQKQVRASPRPLSEANSELSCDLLSEQHACKSSIELSTATSGIGSAGNRYSAEQNTSGDDMATKRSSLNSNETGSAGSGSLSERKRALPKHQRPLTRYLPIFSPDLDLKQHIESAGHQIALCPHVFVDSYSCRGYLHKLGATFHGWARRWFVLDRQRNAFIYYADKSERKPRGGAYFSTIDEVYLDHLNASKSGRPHCTFIVKTKKRSYHLQAASDAAARIWIDAIITGAQGNLDY